MNSPTSALSTESPPYAPRKPPKSPFPNPGGNPPDRRPLAVCNNTSTFLSFIAQRALADALKHVKALPPKTCAYRQGHRCAQLTTIHLATAKDATRYCNTCIPRLTTRMKLSSTASHWNSNQHSKLCQIQSQRRHQLHLYHPHTTQQNSVPTTHAASHGASSSPASTGPVAMKLRVRQEPFLDELDPRPPHTLDHLGLNALRSQPRTPTPDTYSHPRPPSPQMPPNPHTATPRNNP